MKLKLKIAGFYLPRFVKKRRLRELTEVTAEAFDTQPPEMNGLSLGESLSRYAIFTRDCAQAALRNGKGVEAKLRLFNNAHRLGEDLRSEFHVKTMKDVMELSRIVYMILGIDFDGGQDGRVLVRSCFFSSFYSPAVCGIISSLDDGLLAGLSGGGRLEFSRRITDGCERCEACLSKEVEQV
ncbi:MAG TPA: hypothetical protein VIS48_12810 [Candidatus Kryptonia bacterium]